MRNRNQDRTDEGGDESDAGGEDEIERQRRVDPDAPGLGVVADDDEDAPEPNEPA